MAPLFKHMTVCGVGLIGGSLAMIAKEQGLVRHVTGYGRTKENLAIALKRGLIDAIAQEPEAAAKNADLVVLAGPIMTMPALLKAMMPHMMEEAVVTDVGSAKGWVVRELEPMLGERMALVAAHPVAGKETTGAGAADRELFRGRRVIVTPSASTNAQALEKIEALWRATGAKVERMAADAHDRILAAASHLPQLAASALASALADHRVGGLLTADFGASGLRDTTRLALSSSEMWRDICITNRDAIVEAIKLFEKSVADFKKLIEIGDASGLEAAFTRGRKLRERIK